MIQSGVNTWLWPGVSCPQRLVVIDRGHVVAQGPIFEVLSDPAAFRHLGVRAAGALLQAEVAAHGPDGITTLRVGKGQLEVPEMSDPIGSTVRLRVRASDVLVSLRRPEGLSARNVLDARIVALHAGAGPGQLAVLDIGAGRLLARLTKRSVEDLGLVPGARCFAVVKTLSGFGAV